MKKYNYSSRPNIFSSNGIAATSHPLATEEAISILKMGGNAIDAAIAASAVLSVVEPNATGIGGDCFAIIAPKGKNPVSYNGSGISPNKLNLEYFKKNKIYSIGLESPHSVTIPGSVHAWYSMHQDFGNLEFERLFFNAIKHAKNGYKITKKVSEYWGKNIQKLLNNKNSKKIFTKDNRSYNIHQKHRNEPLAKTLEIISKKGIKGFYEGEIAEDIVTSLNELGGLHSLEDLKKQTTIKTETIKSNYKDITLHQCPPNGPGITVFLMMKMMEKYDLSSIDPMSFERFHLEAEITKLAYKLREDNIGDPNFNKININKLLTKENIEDNINKISMNNCLDIGKLNIPAHPETTYLTIVDKDLNAVSFINSICYSFGSGITTNNSGILLQNRGTNFRLENHHPNCIDSNKRPLHTIIPGMVFKENNMVLSYGVMGGQFQPVGQVHLLNNIFDFELSIQESIDFPRGFHFNNIYNLENDIEAKIEKKLLQVGHNVKRSSILHGGGQAIYIDYISGKMIGGSDKRKDGLALGL